MARQETQSERERAEAAALIAQYRSIGPAAILAAVRGGHINSLITDEEAARHLLSRT